VQSHLSSVEKNTRRWQGVAGLCVSNFDSSDWGRKEENKSYCVALSETDGNIKICFVREEENWINLSVKKKRRRKQSKTNFFWMALKEQKKVSLKGVGKKLKYLWNHKLLQTGWKHRFSNFLRKVFLKALQLFITTKSKFVFSKKENFKKISFDISEREKNIYFLWHPLSPCGSGERLSLLTPKWIKKVCFFSSSRSLHFIHTDFLPLTVSRFKAIN
jgi:hypothetical protein